MTSILDTARLKSELRTLRHGIAEFINGRLRLQAERSAAESQRSSEQQSQLDAVELRYHNDRCLAQQEYDEARAQIAAAFDEEYRSVSAQYHQVVRELDRAFESEARAAEFEQADARWMVLSVLDDQSHESPRFQFQLFRKRLSLTKTRADQQSTEIDYLVSAAREFMNRRWLRQPLVPSDPIELPNDLRELEERFSTACQTIRDRWGSMRSQLLPHLFLGWRPVVVFLLGALSLFAAIYGLLAMTPLGINHFRDPSKWTPWCAGIGVGTMLVLLSVLWGVARARSGAIWWELEQADLERAASRQRWGERARRELVEQKAEHEKRYEAIASGRQRALERINGKHTDRLRNAVVRRDEGRREAEATYPPLLDRISERRNTKLQALESAHQARMSALLRTRESDVERILGDADRMRMYLDSNVCHQERSLADGWAQTRDAFLRYVSHCKAESKRCADDWHKIRSQDWRLPAEIPPAVPLGRYHIDVRGLAGTSPRELPLLPEAAYLDLPFALPIRPCRSLLLKASDAGRASAVALLRTAMLRILTAMPAGCVRFTVIDPVGLGEDFAAFMHLADFNEAIVGTRIWTEKSHIEKRLENLSEHMENIFQAYLRNEFATIEEYNQQAGEVAEPYHFVVVANFPANFSEASARRLVSIATSGARCGVHTLVSVDSKQPLPHGFDLADLEAAATVLDWRRGEFVSTDPELSSLRLSLDHAPAPAEFVEIVRSVGQQSKLAHRVEVPFERIAPTSDSLWQQSSSGGIDVPLGRAGATRLQYLRLGKGTAQHVLIAGKTGSGKSSLLHTLITNVALCYSPDEVEFFLVDFKKGVEFKAYATLSLPHARVIGIESDREFGLSVLERLDGILQERGETFRRHGVQDIDGYRRSNAEARLPRVLLAIDEFQEFFVEDDALSQAAALLLDRLVRQGRAFGMHVILGSQTLGGAYALARSTLGQIAVRIALQCSEADAPLILSDENSAARLLSRPGEAIYNDANGLVEGNHPFQVAWLPDDRREQHLRQIRAKALESELEAEPAIVFEGHQASDPRQNTALFALMQAGARDPRDSSGEFEPVFWVGEAVSIKERPRLQFPRRPGSNLLVVGQDVDMAIGTLASSIVAFAAQQSHTAANELSAAIYVINGDARDGRVDSLWRRIAERVPVAMRLAGQNDARGAVAEIADEVRRRSVSQTAWAPMYVVISNLCRMRELRNDEDDFGMSRGSQEPSAGKQLAEIFRDGPAVGVHAIVWCDTFSNMSRWFGYQTLRDFDLRIAFQMNAADSSNLIDSPAASKLGHHRALIYHRETGMLEKIRPYFAPNGEWWAWVATGFANSAVEAASSAEA